MRGGETRPRLALILVALWGVGFELAPGLHVGLHGRWGDHHHETVRFDDHGHDHHLAAAGHHHHHDTEPAPEREQPDHGAGSVAHRGLAALGAPPPILIPGPALAGPSDVPGIAAERPPATSRVTARQRGPPA